MPDYYEKTTYIPGKYHCEILQEAVLSGFGGKIKNNFIKSVNIPSQAGSIDVLVGNGLGGKNQNSA